MVEAIGGHDAIEKKVTSIEDVKIMLKVSPDLVNLLHTEIEDNTNPNNTELSKFNNYVARNGKSDKLGYCTAMVQFLINRFMEGSPVPIDGDWGKNTTKYFSFIVEKIIPRLTDRDIQNMGLDEKMKYLSSALATQHDLSQLKKDVLLKEVVINPTNPEDALDSFNVAALYPAHNHYQKSILMQTMINNILGKGTVDVDGDAGNSTYKAIINMWIDDKDIACPHENTFRAMVNSHSTPSKAGFFGADKVTTTPSLDQSQKKELYVYLMKKHKSIHGFVPNFSLSNEEGDNKTNWNLDMKGVSGGGLSRGKITESLLSKDGKLHQTFKETWKYPTFENISTLFRNAHKGSKEIEKHIDHLKDNFSDITKAIDAIKALEGVGRLRKRILFITLLSEQGLNGDASGLDEWGSEVVGYVTAISPILDTIPKTHMVSLGLMQIQVKEALRMLDIHEPKENKAKYSYTEAYGYVNNPEYAIKIANRLLDEKEEDYKKDKKEYEELTRIMKQGEQ